MNLNEAIGHARKVAKEKYTEGMLCHANPNDDKLDSCIECAKEHEQLADWLEQLKQYHSIGTVEKCKEAINRQQAKKPNIWGDGYDDNGNLIYDMYDCPECGDSYEIDYYRYDYCPNCGQKLDWSDYDAKL